MKMNWSFKRNRSHGSINAFPRSRRGLTLMEVMVVLIIVGILAAIVGPRMTTFMTTSKVTAAKEDIQMIEAALNQYFSVNDSYPNDLFVIGSQYLRKVKLNEQKQMLDAWGIPYDYRVYATGGKKRQRFSLSSAGADNTHGTADDIKLDGGSQAKTAVEDEEDPDVEIFDETID